MIERIEPGRNPGGLWARTLTRSGTVLAEQAVSTGAGALAAAEEAAELGSTWLGEHEGDIVYNVVYDGDTGEVMSLAVAGPGQPIPSRTRLTQARPKRRWWP